MSISCFISFHFHLLRSVVFSGIVAAVRLGRRIFANLCKAMGYIVAIHVPIAGLTSFLCSLSCRFRICSSLAGLSLLPVLFGWPVILQATHIVLIELIIDPSCSVVFEAEPEEPNGLSVFLSSVLVPSLHQLFFPFLLFFPLLLFPVAFSFSLISRPFSPSFHLGFLSSCQD